MAVFDTEALLIFYLGEEGADIVEDLLRRIQNKGAFAVATAIAKKDKLVVGRDDDFKKVKVPLIKVR